MNNFTGLNLKQSHRKNHFSKKLCSYIRVCITKIKKLYHKNILPALFSMSMRSVTEGGKTIGKTLQWNSIDSASCAKRKKNIINYENQFFKSIIIYNIFEALSMFQESMITFLISFMTSATFSGTLLRSIGKFTGCIWSWKKNKTINIYSVKKNSNFF